MLQEGQLLGQVLVESYIHFGGEMPSLKLEDKKATIIMRNRFTCAK
jgi:hypothetical protein